MSGYTEFIISTKNFNKQNVAPAVITLSPSREVLLTGTVYNFRCEAIEGAVVKVSAIDSFNNKKSLGFVITNQFGEFAIAAENRYHINYQFDIYEPLTTG